MSVENRLKDIVGRLSEASQDSVKFDLGNASAGVRVRKVASEVAKELKEFRKEVLSLAKERKADKEKRLNGGTSDEPEAVSATEHSEPDLLEE